MSVLRKHKHVTRKASRFTNQRLRSHWSLPAYRSAVRGLQYDPKRSRHLWRYAPLFHDSSRLVDPLQEFSGVKDVSYRPLYHTGSEGQVDHRFYHPAFNGRSSYTPLVDASFKGLDVVRVPAEVSKKKSSRKIFIAPPSPMVVPSHDKDGAYLQFNLPRQVLVCVRRKQRREVLFALGKGGGKHKRPEWSEDSYIRC